MKPATRITEASYLALETDSDTKHEFVNGEIVAMAGASARHNVICNNVAFALTGALRDRPCLVVSNDQRVNVETTGLYAYPDIAVVCERPTFKAGPRPQSLTNPTVIVEVLSETTEAWDRGAKAAHYRTVASLRELVFVSQLERRVEHYRRNDAGEWILRETVGVGTVLFPALGCEISLEDVYAKLDLLPDDVDAA